MLKLSHNEEFKLSSDIPSDFRQTDGTVKLGTRLSVLRRHIRNIKARFFTYRPDISLLSICALNFSTNRLYSRRKIDNFDFHLNSCGGDRTQIESEMRQ